MTARSKTPLRAVPPNEKPGSFAGVVAAIEREAESWGSAAGENFCESFKAKTVTQAAESGTTRELLVAMRARIATAVEDPNTPARDLAALTKRLVEVVRDIEAIDAREEQEGSASGPVPDEAFDASAI